MPTNTPGESCEKADYYLDGAIALAIELFSLEDLQNLSVGMVLANMARRLVADDRIRNLLQVAEEARTMTIDTAFQATLSRHAAEALENWHGLRKGPLT